MLPGKGLPSVERGLSQGVSFADLRPLLRGGRYFEALMGINQRLARLVEGS